MESKVQINAKKEIHQLEKAKELLAAATKLYSAKGKKIIEIDLKQHQPTDEEITQWMLGPTGNLRAPTVVQGKTIVVGFNQEVYEKLLD